MSFQEIQFQKWEYLGHSVKHGKLLSELCYLKADIEQKGNLRVIFSDRCSLGKGSNETCVFLGLTKDGYGKAVKRIRRNNYLQPAQDEKKILNEFNARESKYVVNYYFLEEDTGTDYVYLVLDLCEESLKKFVEESTIENLQKALPDVLRQILNGLADLHTDPNPILHRDLKPSNVLRDSHGKFLIADFGISRILNDENSTYVSKANTGTEYWIAPESYREDIDTEDKGRYKKESDVYNAGMVTYYVATQGQHPFGVKRYRLDNMLKGNPVGLDEIKNKTLKDLLTWMLNRLPEDRPSANEALKHPFFMSDDEKFEMLCKVGNQLAIKTNDTQSSVVYQLNNESSDWRSQIDSDVYAYFTTDEVNGKICRYGSAWTECLRLIRNLGQHWNDRPRPRPQPFYKIGDHKLYFLKTFPDLPVRVHAAIRSNKKLKNNSELKECNVNIDEDVKSPHDNKNQRKDKGTKLLPVTVNIGEDQESPHENKNQQTDKGTELLQDNANIGEDQKLAHENQNQQTGKVTELSQDNANIGEDQKLAHENQNQQTGKVTELSQDNANIGEDQKLAHENQNQQTGKVTELSQDNANIGEDQKLAHENQNQQTDKVAELSQDNVNIGEDKKLAHKNQNQQTGKVTELSQDNANIGEDQKLAHENQNQQTGKRYRTFAS
ncbi:serine/threonine-protein kinase/endoribonuclease IRE1-like isoform X2 [Xenia sp. Carnegie-2017]|uniref:serine/threonine-protein kinase/endoribonuclease IRE1-like isoform X2 n=1 Tax=Xenia sp. Carnegie-2017 TaxID=2897299 RepID=UPI001F03E1E0|nr:serine/threonine-protein kinase/endoribonuclease IRE1-like isoform X2 [Xenia sp. Carnegie-2017]